MTQLRKYSESHKKPYWRRDAGKVIQVNREFCQNEGETRIRLLSLPVDKGSGKPNRPGDGDMRLNVGRIACRGML